VCVCVCVCVREMSWMYNYSVMEGTKRRTGRDGGALELGRGESVEETDTSRVVCS
jgi:hypothetical protein